MDKQMYFSVGEEVTVKTERGCAELDGDGVVSSAEICPEDGRIFCPAKGEIVRYQNVSIGKVIYFIDGLVTKSKNSHPFAQSALRKKHEGGESFDSLMAGLKSGIPAINNG